MEPSTILLLVGILIVLGFTIFGKALVKQVKRIADILESDWSEDDDGGGKLVVPISESTDLNSTNKAKKASVIDMSEWKRRRSG